MKTNHPVTYYPPSGMVVQSGNNQFGYAGIALDTIIIKITPNSPSDTTGYTYSWHTANLQDGFYIIGTTYSSGSIYLKVIWEPAANDNSPQATVYAYNHCSNTLIQSGGCKTADSVKLTAVIRKPWTNVYSGAAGYEQLTDAVFTTTNTGLAIGDGAGVVRTTNGGKSWTMGPPIRSDNNEELLAFSGPDTGLVVLVNNYAEFTYDGGQTFIQTNWASPLVGDLSSTAFYMASGQVIYSVGIKGQITKTTDGGATWATTNFNILNNFYAITAVGPDTLYACGDIGLIAKTTDAGKTWFRQSIQLNDYLKSLYFVTNNFGFAGGQDGVIVRTTNGGTTWTPVKTGLNFPVIAIRFLNSQHGFIVTNGGEIAESKDGGLTWSLRNPANYGVGSLNKAIIKDRTVIFGLQENSIYSYDLTQP